jgi:NADH-quinone oxidoreductase subunit J
MVGVRRFTARLSHSEGHPLFEWLFELFDWFYDIWPTALFSVMALTTVGCSVAVVVSQNVVRSAVWLLFTLTGTAGLFFLLGADFVGATQLLIYVGGTLILVIFGVMLTARGPFVHMKTKSGEWAIASVVGLMLLGLLGPAILRAHWRSAPAPNASIDEENSPTTIQLGLEFLGVPPQGKQVSRDPAGIGYLLPFEIVSVHLLVVMIGAAYLARAKRRKTPTAAGEI